MIEHTADVEAYGALPTPVTVSPKDFATASRASRERATSTAGTDATSDFATCRWIASVWASAGMLSARASQRSRRVSWCSNASSPTRNSTTFAPRECPLTPTARPPTSAWRTPSDVSRADASRAAWRIFGATTPSTAVRSS